MGAQLIFAFIELVAGFVEPASGFGFCSSRGGETDECKAEDHGGDTAEEQEQDPSLSAGIGRNRRRDREGNARDKRADQTATQQCRVAFGSPKRTLARLKLRKQLLAVVAEPPNRQFGGLPIQCAAHPLDVLDDRGEFDMPGFPLDEVLASTVAAREPIQIIRHLELPGA